MSLILLGVLWMAWGAVAVALVAAGVLTRASLPPPAFAVAVTTLVLLLVWRMPALRMSLRDVPGLLVSVHVLRLPVGVYFLYLGGRGTLPLAFAFPAAIGDVLVASAAIIVLALSIPARSVPQRRIILAWNVVGLADLVLVMANGVRLLRVDADIAVPFASLPLGLLPLFLIPTLLASHALLFAWYHHARVTGVRAVRVAA